ncbi:hypothetical protein HDV01_005187 [Terramyces sp. JEL0728]|nr:hypothetical protein HDV01_005187 [Terramyces sp. JEL0728]
MSDFVSTDTSLNIPDTKNGNSKFGDKNSDFVSTDTSLNIPDTKNGNSKFGDSIRKLTKYLPGSRSSLNKPVYQNTDISEVTFRNSVKRIPSTNFKSITNWFSKGKSRVTEKEKEIIVSELETKTRIYRTAGDFEDRENDPVDEAYLKSMQREYASSAEDNVCKVPFRVGDPDIYNSPTVEMLPKREETIQRADSLKRSDSIKEFQGRRQGIYIPTTLKEARENPSRSAFEIDREAMVSAQNDAFKVSDKRDSENSENEADLELVSHCVLIALVFTSYTFLFKAALTVQPSDWNTLLPRVYFGLTGCDSYTALGYLNFNEYTSDCQLTFTKFTRLLSLYNIPMTTAEVEMFFTTLDVSNNDMISWGELTLDYIGDGKGAFKYYLDRWMRLRYQELGGGLGRITDIVYEYYDNNYRP